MTGVTMNRIKEMLLEKGISQKELSNLTGITESAISHYVNGERVPRGMNLVKIADALGTTTDDLLNSDRKIDKGKDLVYAKALIARNASKMTRDEKIEFLKLLMTDEDSNET